MHIAFEIYQVESTKKKKRQNSFVQSVTLLVFSPKVFSPNTSPVIQSSFSSIKSTSTYAHPVGTSHIAAARLVTSPSPYS